MSCQCMWGPRIVAWPAAARTADKILYVFCAQRLQYLDATWVNLASRRLHTKSRKKPLVGKPKKAFNNIKYYHWNWEKHITFIKRKVEINLEILKRWHIGVGGGVAARLQQRHWEIVRRLWQSRGQNRAAGTSSYNHKVEFFRRGAEINSYFCGKVWSVNSEAKYTKDNLKDERLQKVRVCNMRDTRRCKSHWHACSKLCFGVGYEAKYIIPFYISGSL